MINELLKGKCTVNLIVSHADNFIVGSDSGLDFIEIKEITNPDYTSTYKLKAETFSKIIATHLAISANGKYLAFSYEDEKINKQKVMIMDFNKKEIIEELETGYINSLSFSNDSKYLAMATWPQLQIKNDKCETEKQEKNLQESDQQFKSFKIYNLDLKEYIQNMSFESRATQVLFSPNGIDLFIGLENGKIIHLKKIENIK